MALPASTLATYEAIGNREDLSNLISRISPTDTPFYSSLAKVKASAVKHEWQIQELAAAVATNAQFEGDDPTTAAVTARLRRGNNCQISYKVARVTGTQQAVTTAGVPNELANQKMLKGLELRRDIETQLLSNQATNAGADATARVSASVLSWIKNNTSKASAGTPGVDPAAADGTGIRTDGTQITFTEARLKTVLAAIWAEGGVPNVIYTGSFNKQQFSMFTGRSTPMEEAKSKKIVASVDAYESDFGKLKVTANRFQRTRDVLVIQNDKWAIGNLNNRNMIGIPLAKTGDSDRVQILSEYVLCSYNEKASGGIFDNTTA